MEQKRKKYIYLPFVDVKCKDGIVSVTESEHRVYKSAHAAYDVAVVIANDQRSVDANAEVNPRVLRFEVMDTPALQESK